MNKLTDILTFDKLTAILTEFVSLKFECCPKVSLTVSLTATAAAKNIRQVSDFLWVCCQFQTDSRSDSHFFVAVHIIMSPSLGGRPDYDEVPRVLGYNLHTVSNEQLCFFIFLPRFYQYINRTTQLTSSPEMTCLLSSSYPHRATLNPNRHCHWRKNFWIWGTAKK